MIILVLTPAYAQEIKTTAKERQKIVTNILSNDFFARIREKGGNKEKRINKGHKRISSTCSGT